MRALLGLVVALGQRQAQQRARPSMNITWQLLERPVPHSRAPSGYRPAGAGRDGKAYWKALAHRADPMRPTRNWLPWAFGPYFEHPPLCNTGSRRNGRCSV